MPSSLQARRIRSAISPRLAIGTSLIFPGRLTAASLLADREQWLVEFDRLTIVDMNGGDDTGLVGLDLVHHFHRFDDTDDVADLDLLSDIDERLGRGRGCPIEGADHRRRDYVIGAGASRRLGWWLDTVLRRCRCECRRCRVNLRLLS